MHEISLKTERKTQLIEITDLVRDALGGTNGASAALVYVPHTTAGVAINERIDPELVTDLENAFNRVVGDDWEWRHDDADGPNAPSHARASLASSPQVLIPLRDGSLALGTYQGVFFCEFDGPRERKVYVTTLCRYATWRVAAPVTKGEELELDVDSLAYGGNGVARLDGFVVFVRRGLPGDRVRARVTKVKRSHAEALATEVLRPGPERVEAPCAHFPACGGCRFQDLAYEAQLEQKQMQVRDALQRLAGIAEPPLEGILPCEPEIFHYRNKLEYSFTSTPEGPALGFHRAGRWDEVLEIERCWLTDELGNGIRDAVRGWAREEGLEAYSQADGSGYLRHLVVRQGRNTGQALVQLVTAPGDRFETGYLVDVLRRFPEVRSVHWAVNDTPAEVTNLPTRLLWGEEWIEEELCGLRFRVRPNAFLQTNTAMAERLYALAREPRGSPGARRSGISTAGSARSDSRSPRRADGLGDRGLGGVGRLRARERRAQHDHERGILRRQRRRGRSRSCSALRPAGRRRGRPASGRARGQGAAAARPNRRAAARLRLLQPDDARG